MSSDEESEDETQEIVRVVGCDIYFYGDIDRTSILKFTETFRKLEIDLRKKAIELPGYDPIITVHICSDGGDVYAGMGVMDTLRRSNVRVHTIAEGTCCSAATFMLLGGKKRMIGKHAHILIHQLSSGFMGKYKDLRDELKTCKKIMKMMKCLYESETKIPKPKFKEMMTHDVYIDSSECLKYEIVHEIV
jgi:ATP-dependent Clp endopeptidase proteolytic subunit ClpP